MGTTIKDSKSPPRSSAAEHYPRWSSAAEYYPRRNSEAELIHRGIKIAADFCCGPKFRGGISIKVRRGLLSADLTPLVKLRGGTPR
ncbi:MAG: hypothetical protein GY820_22390 [Gammaproteobacteria bacterium]|nr:hypothetical protein [Gammaproteobacteria bacterium]